MAKTKETERNIPKKYQKTKRAKVVIRILGTDVDGEKPIFKSLTKIKGVSHSFAKALCKTGNIDPKSKLGSYTESQIAELEELIKNPIEHGIPSWLVNRRRDHDTNENKHMTSSDIDMTRKFDIKRLIEKKSYKGVRHMLGLPVRGQRTKSSFRKGKTVGVVRKANRPQPKGKGK